AIGGLTEVQLGNLAAQRGGTDLVKNLGQRLARDHQRLNQELQQIAGRNRLQVPRALDEKHQKHVQDLQKMTGAQFDQAFLRDQIKDHENDIAAFEAQAKNSKDPAIRDFAEKALPTLRE